MSRFGIWTLMFGIGFAALASWVSPRLLAWYATPPVPIGVTCDPAIGWAMENLIMFQLIGFGLGMGVGALVFTWIRGKKTPSGTNTAPGL